MKRRLGKQQAFAAAMLLPPKTWMFLFEFLIGDVEVEPDPEIEAAWLEEAERRLRDVDEGRVEMVPWEVVKARLDAQHEEWLRNRPPEMPLPNGMMRSEVIDACMALPVEVRVDLAGRLLERLRTPESPGDDEWLADSDRWLARVREKLAQSTGGRRLPRRPKEADA